MKISIITASYNYAEYIEDAINSVISQSYQDWELIIVDDGSSDNSVEIIQSYCEKDSRIKFFQHSNGQNKGLKETLLLGIKHACGDWIAFLESDDYFSPDNLSKKNGIIQKYPDAKLIFNKIKFIAEEQPNIEPQAKHNIFLDCFVGLLSKPSRNDNNTKSLAAGHCEGETEFRPRQSKKLSHILIAAQHKQQKKCEKIQEKLSEMEFPKNMFYDFYINNMILTFSCVMVESNLLKNTDFNTPVDVFLDWWLWIHLAYKNDFYYIDEELTFWRLHKESYIFKGKKPVFYPLQVRAYRDVYDKNNKPLKLLLFMIYSSINLFFVRIYRFCNKKVIN